MDIQQVMQALEAGEAFAYVFQRRDSNDFDPTSARLIVRVIATPGGDKLAMHELDGFTGRTGSGIYDAESIAVVHAGIIRRWSPRTRGDLNDYAWRPFRAVDLPANLQLD